MKEKAVKVRDLWAGFSDMEAELERRLWVSSFSVIDPREESCDLLLWCGALISKTLSANAGSQAPRRRQDFVTCWLPAASSMLSGSRGGWHTSTTPGGKYQFYHGVATASSPKKKLLPTGMLTCAPLLRRRLVYPSKQCICPCSQSSVYAADSIL